MAEKFNEADVLALWRCARKHNSSIPDEALNAMRKTLLDTLRLPAGRVDEGVAGLCQRNPAPNAAQPMAVTSPTVNLTAALAQNTQGEAVAPFIVGNAYQAKAGELVRFVSVHNEGTRDETMADEDGVHRYTRRDFGRVTGTAHDYSDPRNTPPLYTRPAERARVPEGWALVPIKPTQQMLDAMGACEYPLNAWDEALAAAPSQPKDADPRNYVSGSVDHAGEFHPTIQRAAVKP